MLEGWIKLYRQLLESEFWTSEKFTKAQAWVDLLLLANHKAQTAFIRGVEVKVERGQLAYSQLTLATRWKWNRKTVEKYLGELRRRKMVDTKTDNVTTLITIINYSKYQSNEDIDGQQSGHQNGHQKDTKTDTNKNVKNVKNILLQDKPANPHVSEFIKYASETFLAKYNERLCVDGGKDGAIVRKLLGTYSPERLKGLWDVFMQSTDPFIEQAGRSIGVFKSQVNKLLLVGNNKARPTTTSAKQPCKVCNRTDYAVIIGDMCIDCKKGGKKVDAETPAKLA